MRGGPASALRPHGHSWLRDEGGIDSWKVAQVLDITLPGNDGSDAYTVEVFSIPADVQQSVTSGVPAVLTVTKAGQNIVASFDALAGDAVSYSLSSDTGVSADVVLRAPSGTDITHGPGGFVGAGTLNAPAVTVPETSAGTPYSLEINPRGTGVGTFTLTVVIVSS